MSEAGAGLSVAPPPAPDAAPEPDVIVEEEATRAAARVRGFLTCVRCHRQLERCGEQPQLLSGCLHTLCLVCSEQIGGNAAGDVNCPLCHTVSDSVTRHSLLEEILQRAHDHHTAARCGQCSERGSLDMAAGVCVDCASDLCLGCIEAHKMTKATWDHKVKMFPEADSEQRCPAHGKPYDNYCDTCAELGCGDCILSDHRSHVSFTLTVKATRVLQEINRKLDGLRDVKNTTHLHLTELKRKWTEYYSSKEACLSSIQDQYEQYQSMVNSFFNRQLVASRRQHDQHIAEVRRRLRSATEAEAHAVQLGMFVDKLLASRRPATALHYSQSEPNCLHSSIRSILHAT